MSVGVDIEDISRFENKQKDFLQRVFTPLEIEYCEKFSKPQAHYAVRFCAKEAVIKSLTPLGITISEYNSIEVYNDENKCPHIRILKNLDKDIRFELSLSHDRTKAVAFVNAVENN